ncbi:MAG: RNA pseudouridine synthase [Magnetococcales bacterium]|nr:RNA pseudouridine synthase [Magnetococcales bacterium]
MVPDSHPPPATTLLVRKIDRPRGRWFMAVHPAGKPAATSYRVMGRGDGVTWLELHPHTGRTHQIRVHCAHLGCPILGDPLYNGGPAPGDGRLLLHARALAIPLYAGKPPQVTAPAPEDLLGPLRACGHLPEAPP